MNDAFPKDARDRIALRFWQDEGELHRTGEVIDRFFDAFQNRLRLVLCLSLIHI